MHTKPERALLTVLIILLTVIPVGTQAAAGNNTPLSQLLGTSSQAVTSSGPRDLLPPDQAYRFSARVKDARTVSVHWQIADGYYLYRNKIKLSLQNGTDIQPGDYVIPPGKPKHDEIFGQVEVFYHELAFDMPLLRQGSSATDITLLAKFQGCADIGVCYPPMDKTLQLRLPLIPDTANASDTITAAASPGSNSTPPIAEQDRIAAALQNDALWTTLLSFLGFGILLAFTPCIFPMIPILSGIIVGQGERITTARAFSLSLAYVLASALAYTLFGVLAGLFGGNLQATFQQPWILIAFSAVFVLLSLSMFGFYELQMPNGIQTRLTAASHQQKGGGLIGAAVMGFLSAFIVGPCVAAPLAGALIYIGQTGDAVLGGLALFALGLGSGIPLLVIGTSAGKLLPKAGPWMNTTKAIFGVGLLAVAVWLLERIVPAAITMLLWSTLLMIPAVHMGATDALPQAATGWHKLSKGLGLILLVYGILLLIGVASGSQDPLRPLHKLADRGSGLVAPSSETLAFKRIASLNELESELAQAGQNQQWVMLDYYADWCISCKEMEHNAFSDPRVQAALTHVVLLQADVTRNAEQDQALLRQFELIGPPAILFFGPDQQERRAYRVIGYQDASAFLQHLQRLFTDAA